MSIIFCWIVIVLQSIVIVLQSSQLYQTIYEFLFILTFITPQKSQNVRQGNKKILISTKMIIKSFIYLKHQTSKMPITGQFSVIYELFCQVCEIFSYFFDFVLLDQLEIISFTIWFITNVTTQTKLVSCLADDRLMIILPPFFIRNLIV